MFKFSKKVIAVILIFLILVSGNISHAEDSYCKNIIIVYDTGYYTDTDVNRIDTLLHAFNTNTIKMSLNEYSDKVKLEDYDYVFILGLNENFLDYGLLKSLIQYKGDICWIGNGIDEFLKYGKYDLKYVGKSKQIVKVNYKEKDYILKKQYVFNIVESLEKNNQTIAYINDGLNSYPYIVKDKNLFYVSNINFNDILFYIFSNELNEIFDMEINSEGKVFLRLDYVNPFTDKENLKKISDYLYSKSIPFMVNLTPAYLNKENEKIITISEDEEMIDTLKYIQDKGGSIILNGYTHQYKNEKTSKEGIEFWDEKDNKPVTEDINLYVKNRILSGLRICIENEIYPIAFQAPNNVINSQGYKELKKYFSTYVGRHQSDDNVHVNNTYPYIIKNSVDFNKLIPENLGFINQDDDFNIDKIEEELNCISLVRGYSSGINFYPDLNIDYLNSVVEKLEAKDIKFMDLKGMKNWIKIDDINIESNNGVIKAKYNENLSNKNKKTDDKLILIISNAVMGIIVGSIVLFIVTFLVFKNIEKNKFFR
ncbi:DUF2334 domain-containing protein [Romboutsia maritimum]|uniref:DUF2334 domain-containing protein n=1 Tax=Romboutsia maritimum TaxID=2020948 RepID=A0A371IT30_9FIRM|nr:DUF2334 domain-containing protein [Romboutsia maritimum]RDY23632.1 DUF2334 domain-containing protein [Romboutsia maritimum]